MNQQFTCDAMVWRGRRANDGWRGGGGDHHVNSQISRISDSTSHKSHKFMLIKLSWKLNGL